MKKILFYSVTLLLGANLLAQNVGIGTITPDASAKLDVVDANRGLLIPRVNLTATNASGPVTSPATSLLVYNTATAGTAPNNVWPGYYYWDGTKWVRLDTGNGDWKLDGNNNGALRYIGTNDNYDFPIYTNGTEKMRVTAGGNVGIGTTTPGAKLHVEGGDIRIGTVGRGIWWDWPNRIIEVIDPGDGISRTMRFRNSMSTGEANPLGGFDFANNDGISVLRILNHNVGIGTTAPGHKLHVVGNVFATGVVYCNSTALCSDQRWKTNMKPIQNALDNVLKIQGVTYNWKVDEYPDKHFSKDEQIGFIAQEIEKTYPQVVFTDKDGYKSIDYSKLTPILVEAIKDQQKIIQHLQEENFKIKQANLQLKEENNQIKAEMKLLNEKVDNLINSLSNDKKLVTTE